MMKNEMYRFKNVFLLVGLFFTSYVHAAEYKSLPEKTFLERKGEELWQQFGETESYFDEVAVDRVGLLLQDKTFDYNAYLRDHCHKKQSSVLHKAVSYKKSAILDVLIEHTEKSLLNIQDVYGDTPLSCAVESADTTLIKKLLEANADVRIKNNMNKSPLLMALLRNNKKIIKLLVDSGATAQNLDLKIFLWYANQKNISTEAVVYLQDYLDKKQQV